MARRQLRGQDCPFNPVTSHRSPLREFYTFQDARLGLSLRSWSSEGLVAFRKRRPDLSFDKGEAGGD